MLEGGGSIYIPKYIIIIKYFISYIHKNMHNDIIHIGIGIVFKL